MLRGTKSMWVCAVVVMLLFVEGCGSVELEKAKEMIKSGDFFTAQEILKKEYEQNPTNTQTLYWYGKLMYVMRKYRLAIDLLVSANKGYDLEPEDKEEIAKMLGSMSNLMLGIGLKEYNNALEMKKKMQIEKMERALDTAKKILLIYDEVSGATAEIEADKALLRIAYFQKDIEAINRMIEKARRISGGDVKSGYETLIAVYVEKKEYKQAVESIEKQMLLLGETMETRINRVHLMVLAGQEGRALADLERLVVDKPDDVRVLFLLGCSYYKLDRFSEAIETFGKILAVDPANLKTMYNLSLSGLFHAGEIKRSQTESGKKEKIEQIYYDITRILERVVDDSNSYGVDVSYWELLSVLYDAAGNKEASKLALDKVNSFSSTVKGR
ncbi:hypothetical protein CHS0354_024015 [Potamilus streckersoni]|uniref:Tetratricopeptide repeat protein n=1 Tax=Potamilus streckersoni TaxID=2493646 RepID=A0AAE0RZK4_9BIVA|nr:hypothetical protein CHS0354_024015 [Potamilus streckersoni]